MSAALFWQAGFAALSGSLALAPIVPAFRAWQQRDANNAPPSADGYGEAWLVPMERFRTSMQTDFAALLQLARESQRVDGAAHTATRGAGDDGAPFIILGPKDHLAEHLPPSARRLRQMILSVRHLDIPGELVCERPLYADGRVNVAHDAVVRTVLAGREVVIGMHARVKRWAHADHRLDAAEGAVMYGCVSAGREMSLARRTRFERLYAPRITFGRMQVAPPLMPLQRIPYDPPPSVNVIDDRWIVKGDFFIPAGCDVNVNLLVSGHLVIDEGSRVHGNVHVGRSVVLAKGARINGSLYAESSVHLGERCQVLGPLITLRALRVDAFSELGQLEHPTTVSARKIRIAESCIAHGALWARQRGEVVADTGGGK